MPKPEQPSRAYQTRDKEQPLDDRNRAGHTLKTAKSEAKEESDEKGHGRGRDHPQHLLEGGILPKRAMWTRHQEDHRRSGHRDACVCGYSLEVACIWNKIIAEKDRQYGRDPHPSEVND